MTKSPNIPIQEYHYFGDYAVFLDGERANVMSRKTFDKMLKKQQKQSKGFGNLTQENN